MPDFFLILAPVLLFPIVAMLRFVGCLSKPEFQGNLSEFAVNCGGPQIEEGGITYFDEGDPDFFDVSGGQPLKLQNAVVTDANGNSVSSVYGTCRTGGNITYKFRLASGSYRMTLRFAEIGNPRNAGERVFSFSVDNGAGSTFNLPDGSNSAYDIIARAGGRLIARDEQLDVIAVGGKQMSVRFESGSGSPLINAIECSPFSGIAITPGAAPIIEGQAQQFTAIASWDSAAEIAWSVASGPGQIDAAGIYTAPASVTLKTSAVIQAAATFDGQVITANAMVAIYPHRDAITRGDWIGTYGIEGFILANNPQDTIHTRLPAHVAQFSATRLDGTPVSVFTFPSSIGDARSLKESDGSNRACIVWNDASGFMLSFDFLDATPRLVSLYFVDFDGAIPPRDQTITILNADNNAVLAQEQLQTFTGGVYLLWVLRGRIKIRIVPNVRNAVACAVFFG